MLGFPDPAGMGDTELAAYLRAASQVQERLRFDWSRYGPAGAD